MPLDVPATHAMTVRDLLAERLSMIRGRHARIIGIRRLNYFRSSHSFARLLVSLEGGEKLCVVAKRLRPGLKRYGNEREILTYTCLLASRQFGAPALYGSVYDESHHRFILFLEDVGNNSLEHADDEEWVRAVEVIADMHASFLGREDELHALGCLHKHDAVHYYGIVSDALTNMTRGGEPGVRARFESLRPRLSSVIDFLVAQPRTLVHGDLFPDNVMVDSEGDIRLIDWEAAAIGVGALDLVGLIEGWTGRRRDLLLDAYMDRFERCAGLSVDRRQFALLVLHCGILHCIWYLAWGDEYCWDSATANELMDTMEAGLQRLERSPSGE